MRKVLFVLAGLVVAASCQKTVEEQNINEPQKKTVLTAEFEQIAQPGTKSVIELVESPAKAAKFKWVEGDEIAVMTDAGFKKFLLQANAEDENKIEFVSDEECNPQEGAIYPFAAKSTDLSIVNLPTSYGSLSVVYNENTNMPMYADLEGDKLSFKHLGGVAMFTIENLPADASKFVFAANGKKITGEFVIDYSGENAIINTSSDAANNAVTINFQSFGAKQEGITNFYIPLPVGDYNGFTLQIKDATDKDLVNCTSTKAFSVARASVKVFNGFNCDNHLLVPVELGANSYIIPLNSDEVLKIPTERVNVFWKDASNGGNLPANALDSETSFTWVPEVIWIEDTTGDITEADKSNVVFCDENGDPQSEFMGNVPFYVKANSATAKNILIGIKKQGTSQYLWSWHLWLTDYNPDAATPVKGQVHEYNSYKVMDRNLGATITNYDGNSPINPSTDAGIRGLYYQFGRKDPFQSIINTIAKKNDSQQSYAYSVNNPDTFIIYDGDWHTPSNTTYPWNGSSADEKSIFDPCPAGWRVPANETIWTGFTNENFIWDGINKGRLYNSQVWYPAAGYRSYSSSSVSYMGTTGYYLSSSPVSTTLMYYLRFNSSNVYPSYGNYRAFGVPVRCVKE